ncbi:CGNR zinc finger domain-containing protein [Jiangella gansuensis]|uniref:CGNR zinc finger domain-containing protein n=1 Tax=Jiangella gansuensis TaxID=281473 RepID=UPI00047A7701|nr:CGNR zinc finger domain-containing protein [Jiangella gansuensis]
MYFNHYSDEGAQLAAALVDRRLDSPADVARLAAEHDVLLERRPSPADVTGLHEWQAPLTEVVDAVTHDERVAALNRLLARGTSHPSISTHDGSAPHVHFRPDGVSVARQLAAITAFGLAWFLTQRGLHRFARCAADDCTRTFADVTRNGRQRYCSPRCANRSAVRRHRAGTSARK